MNRRSAFLKDPEGAHATDFQQPKWILRVKNIIEINPNIS
jgi:hypothetical protein